MFRLIRLTLLLIVACTAAIFVAHLIGGTRPNPLAILFTNPDGTPCQRSCLLGVRPGETKFEDAVSILRKHPVVSNIEIPPGQHSYYRLFYEDVYIDLTENNNGTVRIISWMFKTGLNSSDSFLPKRIYSESVSMADLMSIEEVPQKVVYYEDCVGISLIYYHFYDSHLEVVAHPTESECKQNTKRFQKIGFHDPILGFVISSYSAQIDPAAKVEYWRGFTSIRR